MAGSLVQYLHYLGVKVIAPGLDNEDKVTGARNVGCEGYSRWEPLPFDTLLPREEVITLTRAESEALAETLPEETAVPMAAEDTEGREEPQA